MSKVEPKILKQWTDEAKKVLQGKTITEVRYLNDEEMEMMGWYKRPVCFFLQYGHLISFSFNIVLLHSNELKLDL